MKHTIVAFRLLSAIACSTMALCTHAFDQSDFLVHMGADLQGRHVPLQDNLGGNLVQQDYAQVGAYAGMRFFEDNLGLEAGFQRSNSMSRDRNIAAPASYFSGPVPAGSASYISQTKSSMQNSYVVVVGLLPLSHRHHLKLMASVGAGRTRAKIMAHLNPNPTASTLWPLRFMAIKWIPKASIGLQWMASEHLGLRALAGWEQMGRFRQLRASNANGSVNNAYFASFKNGSSASFGMFYRF